jgi:hypothetical protein
MGRDGKSWPKSDGPRIGKIRNRRPQMSIMFELCKPIGKRPCAPGTRVDRCPLIINENSEDLFMSNTFGLLKYLTPTIWLIPFLNIVFKGRDFRKLCHGSPQIELWKKLRSSASFSNREGIEEVDIVITIRQVVILVECKYRSLVQPEVGTLKRDQIIRYLDAAVFKYWPDSGTNRQIFFVLLTDDEVEPEILSQYRNPQKIFAGLTQSRPFIDYKDISERLAQNVGWGKWSDILQVLKGQDLKKVTSIEAVIVKDLIAYLSYKTVKSQHSEIRGKGR